jgi:hypothetical protein
VLACQHIAAPAYPPLHKHAFASPARQREVLLRREYAVAVDLINAGLPQQQHIVYIPWGEQQLGCTSPGVSSSWGVHPLG